MRLKHLCTALGIAAPYLCNTNPSFKIAAKKLSQPKSRRYAAVGLETRLRAQCTALPRRSPQGDVPGGHRRSAPGRPCGRPEIHKIPDIRSWRRCPPQKAPLSGDPIFFQCSGRQSRPSAKVFAERKRLYGASRRPICDGAPATTPLTPGRCPGWRRRSAPGRPCGRPEIHKIPDIRSWRRCRRSISARAGTGGRRSPGRRR